MSAYHNGTHGWQLYADGACIGKRGSEGGEIIRDDEHADGARITLEKATLMRVPFAITCGIYGWMVHTRFFADEVSAFHAYDEMKIALADILHLIADEQTERATDALEAFVERFP
jgi:hypothetical protein